MHTIPSDDIVATDNPDVYTVVSQSDKNTTSTVVLQLGECTCPIRMQSQPCKHQFAAAMKYRKSSFNTIPTYSPQGHQLFAAVALGQHCQPISFYSSVHKEQKKNI